MKVTFLSGCKQISVRIESSGHFNERKIMCDLFTASGKKLLVRESVHQRSNSSIMNSHKEKIYHKKQRWHDCLQTFVTLLPQQRHC
jgi:hypothetical protein